MNLNVRFHYKDWKMVIFQICLINQLNVWVHYNFMGSTLLGQTFFLFEIFRFMIFFLIFYYYCQKAGKLLPDKKKIMVVVRILFMACFITIMGLGTGIWIIINNNHEIAQKLCMSSIFESYRYSTLLMCACFGVIFYYIT